MLLSINRKQNIKGGLKYLRNIHLKDSEKGIKKSRLPQWAFITLSFRKM
jgi:hypothetical protein